MLRLNSITEENWPEIENTRDIKEERVVDYDELLTSAGECGYYQILLMFSTLPFNIFGAFTYFGQLFITEVSPNHWCWIPELENLTVIERRNLAIPVDESSRYGYSQCHAYSANWTQVLLTGIKPDPTWSKVPCAHGWEFNLTEIPYPTISSELGWVCDKDNYQATAQSIFFVGSIVGGLIVGWVADRYGRLVAAVMANLIGCIAGTVTIFATNFIQFAICRFFLGMAYDNCVIMTYLLLLEYIAPKYRSIIANLPFAIFFTFGLVILPWICLICGHWKTISLALSLPMALAVLAPFIMPESPRWLLSKGRIDEAVEKIETIARINKKDIPVKLMTAFKHTQLSNPPLEGKTSILEMLRIPLLRMMFFCMCLCYMCCMIVFDALVRTIGQLNFDFFLSFTLLSFTECPSLLLMSFIVDWTGRKWLTLVSILTCCVFSFLIACVESGVASVVFAFIARFFINMACNTSMQWAAEMFPTPVRGSAVSIVHIFGYVGTVVSPFVAYLDTIVDWLPLIVISGLALIGGIVSMGLPETANKEMPQTFESAEMLMKSRKLLDVSCLKKKRAIRRGHVNESFELS